LAAEQSPGAEKKVVAPEKTGGIPKWRLAFAALSMLLCFFFSFCYYLRPDSLAAITVFPVLTWSLLGFLISLPAFFAHKKVLSFAILLVWISYLLVFAEEPTSLLRSITNHPSPFITHEVSNEIRVITLNCAGGSNKAAEEVIPYHPDIVLLQENPGRAKVNELAQRLFDKNAVVAWGPDAAIIAGGKVRKITGTLDVGSRKVLPKFHSSAIDAVTIEVEMLSGRAIKLMSLRLMPPLFRMDLYSRDCYVAQTEDRRRRREQLAEVYARIAATPDNIPLIMGGDFNAPQGDAIFRQLQPRLHDTFGEAGVGWGNTIINDFPLLRIDQIWASRQFRAKYVRAIKTVNSDHRLVVCDLMLVD
jgi:endonuclease/exonuclease/phosphatase (EEP) superfamily protein YafD